MPSESYIKQNEYALGKIIYFLFINVLLVEVITIRDGKSPIVCKCVCVQTLFQKLKIKNCIVYYR